MKTEMWSGISEVVQRSQRAMILYWRSQGLVGVQGNGSIVLESQRVVGARVGGAVGVQSWIRQESQQLDGDLDNLTSLSSLSPPT